EEADEDVELSALAGQPARRGQRVVERLGVDLLGVVGRLGGGSDEPADLARPAAGVGGPAVAEILADGALLRDRRPVVAAFPTGILVEPLQALLARRRCPEATGQDGGAHGPSGPRCLHG